MEITLKKMGNSTGFVMPPPVLRDLGLSVGRSFRLQTTVDGKIILEPKRKFRLSDMIAQCDHTGQPPVDIRGWDNMPAVGGEVW
jgi:antitoxin ChpS